MKTASSQDYAYNVTCLNHLRHHIKRELQASITYLAMVTLMIQTIKIGTTHIIATFVYNKGSMGQPLRYPASRIGGFLPRERIRGEGTRFQAP